MTPIEIDPAEARSNMVTGQLLPNKVTDQRIIEAMRTLPRERFVPSGLAALAYVDVDLALGGGRALMQPMTLARLVQLGAPAAGERVLVVGCGAGYGAAVLAACGAAVVAVEQDEALAHQARGLAGELFATVALATGPLAAGWRAGAPYDLVFIEGGFELLPEALAGQIRPAGGRVVGVRLAAGSLGQAVLGERAGQGAEVSFRPAFDCTAAVLPGFARARGFVF